jgi:branched-chain amino acid transport system permease protein
VHAVVQLVVNGILAAAIYLLVGTGFYLVFTTVRFFHFAHGILFTAGAYSAFLFTSAFGLPIWISAGLSVCLLVALGCSLELAIYHPLKRGDASPLVLLLASLGIYIALQNIISMVFGDDTKSIRHGVVKEGLNLFGARITPVQIAIVVGAVVLTAAVAVFLKTSKIGKAMRAVACDPQLAEVSGIDNGRVILWAFGIGSGLAAVAGILVALDVDMTPTMGMRALMMGVVAVIIGGRGSILGVALGALLLGTAQHLGVWKISSQWQDAIAFVILLIFLIFRPQGFFSRKTKAAAI